jgi:hypothetical protein
MPFTPAEETAIRAMLAEWQTGKDAQAQSLIDQKQTAVGQLRGLAPYLSQRMAVAVEAETKP